MVIRERLANSARRCGRLQKLTARRPFLIDHLDDHSASVLEQTFDAHGDQRFVLDDKDDFPVSGN
jgi:hypothetical protein